MDREDRLEAKLDKITDKISSIDSTLAAQHQSLVEHIRRTELLETRIEPIEKDIIKVKGAASLLGYIVGSLTVLAAIAEILGYLTK